MSIDNQKKTKIMFMVGTKGNFIFLNNKLSKLLGYSRKELINTHFKTIISKSSKLYTAIVGDSDVEQRVKGNIKLLHKLNYIKLPVTYDVVIQKSKKETEVKGEFCVINDVEESFDKFVSNITAYKSLFDNNPDGILVAKTETGEFCYANRIIAQELGYTREELLKMRIKDIHPKEDWDYVYSEFKKMSRGKSSISHEVPCLSKKKELLFFDIKVLVLVIEGLVYCFGFFRNVTESKKAAIKLKDSEERYRELFDNITNGVVVYKAVDKVEDFIIVDFNKTAEKIEQINKESVLGKKVTSVFPGVKKLGLFKAFKEVYRTGKAKTFPIFLYKDDRISGWRENLIYKLPSGEIVSVYSDLTEQKREERRIKEDAIRLNQIIKDTKDWVWEVDTSGLYTYSNDSVYDILGYSKEEIVGEKYFYDLFEPEGKETLKLKAFEAFKKRLPFRNFENINISKNGKKVYLLTSGSPVLGEDKELLGYRGLDSDITAIKNNEIILEQHRKKLTKMVKDKTQKLEKEHYHLLKAQEIAHVGTWEYSFKTGVLEFTKESYRIFGIKENTRITYDVFIRSIFPDDRPLVKHYWIGIAEGKVFDIEHRINAEDNIRWVRESAEVIYKNRKAIKVIGTVLDITKQKESEQSRLLMEKQLSFARKMQTIGSLANGMGHEFNNIIGVIMGLSELLLNSNNIKDADKKHIESIYTQGERAVEVIKNMQSFTAADTDSFVVIDINEQISNISDLLRIMFPKNIHIGYTLDDNCQPIMGNKTNIQQIIFNICNNSLHAMQKTGGNLNITTTCFEHKYAGNYDLDMELGRYVKISISDTGYGIDPETIQHIFNPFFSTKQLGEGIGLGLSVVANIVKKHKGQIRISSIPGKGTCINIYFPVADKKVEKKLICVEEAREGKERILVVEDEVLLAEIYKKGLEKLGYKVSLAFNGAEALKMVEDKPGNFDLVFTDYMMPEIDGVELCKKINKINNKIPFIFATGYSNVIDINRNLYSNVYKILTKPVKLPELTALVRNYFDDV